MYNFGLSQSEIRAFGTMTIFHEFLPLNWIFHETNLISFSYLPRPSSGQSMSKIDFSTVATFLEFSLIFTDIHS